MDIEFLQSGLWRTIKKNKTNKELRKIKRQTNKRILAIYQNKNKKKEFWLLPISIFDHQLIARNKNCRFSEYTKKLHIGSDKLINFLMIYVQLSYWDSTITFIHIQVQEVKTYSGE